MAAGLVPTGDSVTSKELVADQQVVGQLEVGGTTNPSVPTTDPVSPTTNKVCDQPMAGDLKVSEAADLTEAPPPALHGGVDIGKPPPATESGDLERMRSEKEIKGEMVFINAIISSQIPRGQDELGALMDKSYPE